MSSEYRVGNPSSDPNIHARQPSSELWGQWELDDEDTQPQRALATSSDASSPDARQSGSGGSQESGLSYEPGVDPQFSHREHVTGALPAPPSEAPLFRPAYPPYPPFQGYPAQGSGNSSYQQGPPAYPPAQPSQSQGYPAQGSIYPPQQQPGNPYAQPAQFQGYAQPVQGPYPVYSGYPPPYAGYPGYQPYPPYMWQPVQPPGPKRDGYLFGIAITAFICSILVLLAGIGCVLLLLLLAVIPSRTLSESDYFTGIAFFLALAGAGLLGGSFGLYHSIRSLFLRKPSADFSLPRFWIFVILYGAVLGIGFLLQDRKQEVAFPALTMSLIVLAGLFPALAVLALGVRRLRSKGDGQRKSIWPTSWRRFTLAIVSGATSGILLASILELVLQLVLMRGQSANILLCVDRPDTPNCQTPAVYGLLFILVAVIAPLVEETVKPLAVVLLITRIRSAAEAFVLGLACGIGFDLVETTGYISSGYHDWLNVALIRTSAGLLHGFGAAMVALGWYYLVHAKQRRLLLALLCWFYAILQHAIWNGSWGLTLLPTPIGPAIDSWNVNLGLTTIPFYLAINFIEAALMLVFFIYITGRLRTKTPPPPIPEERNAQTIDGKRVVVPT